MEDNTTYEGSHSTVDPADTIPGGPVEQTEGTIKRAMLAGVGAVVTACDVATQQYDRFVGRGQQVTNEWQERADDIRRQNMGARSRVGDYFRGAVDTVLNSVNIPSKSDLDTINVKLNIVSRKLDDLQMDRVRETGGSPPGPPPAPIPPLDEDLAT